MVALAVYISILILVVTTSSTTLCFACYAMFRHRAAFWLSLCAAGLTCFALTHLVLQISHVGLPASSPGEGSGMRGFNLLWQAIGSVVVAATLPRFLLSAYGVEPRALTYRLLDAVTVAIVALSVIRLVAGWHGLASVPSLATTLLRIILFTLIGAAFTLALAFQSRLPDRSLYRTVIVQVGALALLFPFVVLEDLGVLSIAGYPFVAGELLVVSAAVSAALHARRSLSRPKYVVDQAPSHYFVERFGISDRELEIVAGVLGGKSNNDIAGHLFISPRTVEKHLSNIYQKTGIKNRVQLFTLLRSDTL